MSPIQTRASELMCSFPHLTSAASSARYPNLLSSRSRPLCTQSEPLVPHTSSTTSASPNPPTLPTMSAAPTSTLEPHSSQPPSGLRTPSELLAEETANAQLHNGEPDRQHGIQGIDAFRLGMAEVASKQSGVQAGPGEVTFKVDKKVAPGEGEGEESYFGK